MEYLRYLGASKDGAKENKLFGLSAYLTGRFERLATEISYQNVALARRRLVAGSLLSTLSIIGYYGAYLYVIWETIQGRLSIGTLTFLAAAIASAIQNLQLVFSTFSGIADQSLFLSDLLEFFAVKPTLQSKPNAIKAPRPIQRGYEFRDVSFAYPGTSRLVLDHLNFKLEPGQRVALIGENGGGKTTIVKLLSRLYDPTAGAVLLDGIDLREYDLQDLSSQIAVIFQDFMRYDMTVRDNIAIGRIQDGNNLQDVVNASKKSMAHSVVEKLSRGYEQMLGRRFDGGVDLSGGEWQRLALARAYLRNAQVLILDEPTAALDAKAEFEVFQKFADLTQGKMALLISHRFSTVKMAERIMVLEDGKITEEGPHHELIARGGRYSELFELQASSYR